MDDIYYQSLLIRVNDPEDTDLIDRIASALSLEDPSMRVEENY